MKTVAQHKYKLSVAIGSLIGSLIATGGINVISMSVITALAIVVFFEVTE